MFYCSTLFVPTRHSFSLNMSKWIRLRAMMAGRSRFQRIERGFQVEETVLNTTHQTQRCIHWSGIPNSPSCQKP